MPLNIKELNKLWEKEKDKYRIQEVGSGSQRFVKEVLNSTDIFNLKKGDLATKDYRRKNEFIEEKAKKRRRADIIIFIDSEIIIPVEVERNGNIKAGIEQLLEYQRVWEKKYGLLTDGKEWRFYNNNIVIKSFKVVDILNNPSIILEFWNEYIAPKNYYLQFFEKVAQLEFESAEEDLTLEKQRQNFFKDITTLINSFKNKLNLKGYFDEIGEKESDKKSVEITYAYIIQFILYKTLVDNDFENFSNDFQLRLKSIHKDLENNIFSDILTKIKAISNQISENVYHPFIEEQEFINKKLEIILNKPQSELSDITPWLDIFIFIKRYNFANVRTEIFGYIYENYLKDLYEKKNKGQYFTDPSIVDFMLEQIGYKPDEILKRYNENENCISLIDPSCGSGTFLYSAVRNIIDAIPNGSLDTSKKIEQLVNNNIFGLDIEEFPLYLAEMSIIMRMLPIIISEKYNNPVEKKIKVFKTKDSIAEFMDTALRNTLSDINIEYEKHKGQMVFDFAEELDLGYSSYVRDENDLKEMKRSLENQPKIQRRRFDFVIGNPPYIGYNQCCKQGILIFKLIKEKQVKLNDIYGLNLHSTPNNRKKYSPKPNLYAFFIALGIALLKDNGKLCYIIPQTILTAGDLDVLRYHLAKFTTIEKIIIFSGKMFVGRGIKQNKPIPTSSLIFVLNRKQPNYLNQVEIIHYKDPNDEIEKCLENILNNKKVTKKKILQNKLLENVANWNFIKQEKTFLDFYEQYKKNTEDIAIYYSHAWAKQKFNSNFYFDGSFNIPTKEIQNNKNKNINYWEIPNIKSDGFFAKVHGYYPKNKKIKIAEGSQGMVMLSTMYKVLWRYTNPDKFLFIKGRNVLPRFQQFCIASNSKYEIIYLLSILNSKVIDIIIKRLLKSENEKDILLGITSIKQFVRVPKITKDNQFVKNEIIKCTEEMLKLEEVSLSDLVDFSGILMQKFNNISIENSDLILLKYNKKISCRINKDIELVSLIIQDNYKEEELKLDDKRITLSELKSTPVIDFERQKIIKDYINDLVFALYFNIELTNIGLEHKEEIKTKCKVNKYYNLISESI